MIQVVPYRAEHLLNMEPAIEHNIFAQFVTPAVARSLEGVYARSMLTEDGTALGCAGLAPRWHEHWMAWSYLSVHADKHMLRMTRAIKAARPMFPRGRIEAATPMDFKAGRRWLEMLGFKCETPNGMAHYTPDGASYALYSMVNP
jgi:hypothetical protein